MAGCMINWLENAEKFESNGRLIFSGRCPMDFEKDNPEDMNRIFKCPWVISHPEARDKLWRAVGLESFATFLILKGWPIALVVEPWDKEEGQNAILPMKDGKLDLYTCGKIIELLITGHTDDVIDACCVGHLNKDGKWVPTSLEQFLQALLDWQDKESRRDQIEMDAMICEAQYRGWRESHCEHCNDGATAVGNTALLIRKQNK